MITIYSISGYLQDVLTWPIITMQLQFLLMILSISFYFISFFFLSSLSLPPSQSLCFACMRQVDTILNFQSIPSSYRRKDGEIEIWNWALHSKTLWNMHSKKDTVLLGVHHPIPKGVHNEHSAPHLWASACVSPMMRRQWRGVG